MYYGSNWYYYSFYNYFSDMAREIIYSFDPVLRDTSYHSGWDLDLASYVKDFKVEKNKVSGFVKSTRSGAKDHVVELKFAEISKDKIDKLIDEFITLPYLMGAYQSDFLGYRNTKNFFLLCEKYDIWLLCPLKKSVWDSVDYRSVFTFYIDGKKTFQFTSACDALVWKMAQYFSQSALEFLKFRGIDLSYELKKRNIDPKKYNSLQVSNASELFVHKELSPKDDSQCMSLEQLARIEIPYLKDEILKFYTAGIEEFEQLQDDWDVYYDYRTFKESFETVYKKVADKAKKATSPRLRHEDALFFFQEERDVDIECVLFERSEGNLTDYSVSREYAHNRNYFTTIISQRSISKLTDKQKAFYFLWVISRNILKQGAFIPSFVYSGEGNFNVLFIPAIFNPVVKALVLNVGRTINSQYRKYYYAKSDLDDFSLGKLLLTDLIHFEVKNAYRGNRKFNEVGNDDFVTRAFLGREFKESILEQFSTCNIVEKFDGYFNSLLTDFSKYGATIKVYEKNSPLLESYFNSIDADGRSSEVYKKYLDKNENTVKIEQFSDIDDLFVEVIIKDAEGNRVDFNQTTQYNQDIFDKVRYTVQGLCEELSKGYDYGLKYGAVTKDQLLDFFTRVIPCLKKIGFEVELPESLQSFATPDLNISVNLPSNVSFNAGDSFISLAQLLEFDWHLSIGDKFISDEDFEYLASHLDTLVKFNDSLVYMTEASYQDLLKRREKIDKRQPTGLKLLSAAISGSYENTEVNIGENLDKVLKELFKFTQESVPTSINATLREYQVRGFNWLLQNARVGIGSIIADDMGLGKTLQVISLIQKLKDDGEITSKLPVLVVVPTVLLINWQHELRKFAPTLSYEVIYGANAELPKECPDILLTTYGKMRSEIAKFKKKKYRLIVIDEAQAIKNKDTDTRKALCKLDAISCVAMTGTPVENRLSEYWSIMDFVNKGLLGTSTSFNNEFAKPIEKERDPFAIEHFNRLTKPFILRRLKSDKSIINDLPDKLTSNRYCSLTVEQAAMYQKLLDEQMAVIEDKSSSASASIERSSAVLALITGLKQICNGPSNYDKDYDDNVDFSGKGQMLIDVVESQIEADNKVIIFTQFVTTGELIQKWLKEKLNITADFIKGDLNVKKRQEMVDKFQNDDETKVLVLSLKAAGVGLNLTAASTVIHYDLWWNPAVENQATDRAYRIGQTHNVNVVRLICANTFEERIDDMLEAKKDLANLTVAVGESWISKLSTEEIKDIFKLA